MSISPFCPYCHIELTNVDVDNHGDLENDSYTDIVHGICPTCHKLFYWNEVFTFDRYWGFEEETSSGSIFEVERN